jgi:hypothetical protein
MGRGAVMFTPGIGPATVGLSGFALLLASQATLASARRTNARRGTYLVMAVLRGLGSCTHGWCADLCIVPSGVGV